jgi:hypothetical protein
MNLGQKETLLGMFVALFATLSGMYLFLEIFSSRPLEEVFAKIKEGNLYGPIIALGAIPNLFVFFVFLKKKQEYRARGVLIMTFVTAFITLLIKLI